jgi:hypothetical protein
MLGLRDRRKCCVVYSVTSCWFVMCVVCCVVLCVCFVLCRRVGLVLCCVMVASWLRCVASWLRCVALRCVRCVVLRCVVLRCVVLRCVALCGVE